MFILILLLCAPITAASPHIPPIDGVDRTGFFNYMKKEFDSRRLFANIVDTVSSDSAAYDRIPLPAPVAIGLQASEKQPEYYGFVSRKIVEALKCMDASGAEFEDDASDPEYVLTVDESNSRALTRDEDNTADSKVLLRSVAIQAGMTMEEASNIELHDCWFVRSPEMMQITVGVGATPRIRSGWIVERIPLGKFHQRNYQFPVFLTNYSYVDGYTRSIVDVQESKDERGKRIWTPTGWPAFARVRMEQVFVEGNNFTIFRETATGVLIITLAKSMKLSYNIEDEAYEERIALDRHFYHVSCDMKQGTRRMLIRGSSNTTNNGVHIRLDSSNGSTNFLCAPKRTTFTGIPELLQLDYLELKGSKPISSSNRNASIRKIHLNEPTIVPADQEVDEKTLASLILMMLVVSIVALTTVVCVGVCVRQHIRGSRNPMLKVAITERHGDESRRKEGHRETTESSRPSIDAISKKIDEVEDSKPSSVPTRTNSGKKKSISFAPYKAALRTEELVKMIADTDLGSRIDAMVAAGPDGEEEEMQEMQQEVAAIAAPTAAEVV